MSTIATKIYQIYYIGQLTYVVIFVAVLDIGANGHLYRLEVRRDNIFIASGHFPDYHYLPFFAQFFTFLSTQLAKSVTFFITDNKVNYTVRIWNTMSEAKDEDLDRWF
jgi:hypothetical protein